MSVFTSYKYNVDAQEVADLAERILSKDKSREPAAFAAEMISRNINANPMFYRRYGPYWFAVKRILDKYGYKYGSEGNPAIADAYSLSSELATLIAAERFRALYQATWFDGTNTFTLSDEGEDFVLWDSDMEQLRA